MRERLPSWRHLEDLLELARLLGLDAAEVTELNPAGLGLGPGVRRAGLLAADGSLELVGVEARGDALAHARTLATRLERQGRMALIAVLEPRSRLLVLAIGLGDRPMLAVHLDHPEPKALHCLDRLAGAAAHGAAGTAVRIHDALDTEAVGRRFHRGFETTLATMMGALPHRIPERDRHALSLLQLTRVLFLYFVQERGWLDGRPRFLREEVDRVLGARGSVHDRLLRPLFFGTLNLPVAERRPGVSFAASIPFLNGGLFEPHPLERRWKPSLPNPVWRAAFDDLFERFHFTTGEGPEVIAPDMLGRVFEGVMSPEERSSSGTFYTPSALVVDLVREAMAALTSLRLGIGLPEAERRVADPDPAVRQLFSEVTVLDPACGSGAFLLGTLDLLTNVAGNDSLGTRQQIMSRSLFGVDLNPAAVRLAELRLWLALIQVSPESEASRVRPLPNLDGMIRQGDSLRDPLPARTSIGGAGAGWAKARELRHALSEARGRHKEEILTELRAEESAALGRSLEDARDRASALIADLESSAASPTLFGSRQGLSRPAAKRLASLREHRRYLLRLRRRLDREGSLPWFDYPAQFPDVFTTRGGFDLVVGNPPWVRAEAVAAHDRRTLATRYRWWKPRRNRRTGYTHQPDLSVAFLERAFELTAPDGVVAALMPAKLATSAYGETAREALASGKTLYTVADLSGDPRAVFEATTYPMALVAGNVPPHPRSLVRCRLSQDVTADGIEQRRLDARSWVLGDAGLHDALAAARDGHPTLAERFVPRLGVKTGLNRVFLDPPSPIEPEMLAWALRGRDIRPFGVDPRSRLLWTHGEDGVPVDRLPEHSARWVERHRGHLVRRADYRDGPAWIVFRVEPAVAGHRVVWADLSHRLEAVALTARNGRPLIPMNTCYVIVPPDARTARCLAAWLNCTWIRAAAGSAADPASGGYRRFNARAVGGVPLPGSVLEDDDLAGLASRAEQGDFRQSELDDHCNRHLRLSVRHRDLLGARVPVEGRGKR